VNSVVLRHAAAALLVIVCGCGDDPSPATADAKTRRAPSKTDQSSAGTVDLGGNTYRPGTLSAVGSVAGTITLDGTPPPDTMPIPVDDQRVCGKTIEDAIETGPKGGLANAVVWVADVTTGAGLPMEKRVAMSSENCLIEPRVLATVVGATVNFFNDDRALHRFIFLQLGTNDTLTTMPFFNMGQVVASEKLATASGIVEVRCLLHPWTHGYLAVFDHPYFAVTEKDGAFKIDSLPPGSYRVMVWREGMTKPVEQPVTVQANGVGAVHLAVK
jgi:hypothetical protein